MGGSINFGGASTGAAIGGDSDEVTQSVYGNPWGWGSATMNTKVLCPSHQGDTELSCSDSETDARPTIRCGNGIPQTGEECDDGNTTDGDGCSATCTVEQGWSCQTFMNKPLTSICLQGTAFNSSSSVRSSAASVLSSSSSAPDVSCGIPTGRTHEQVALAVGTKLYVVDPDKSGVDVFDLASHTQGFLLTTRVPFDLAAIGTTLYVSTYTGGLGQEGISYLSAYDTTTDKSLYGEIFFHDSLNQIPHPYLSTDGSLIFMSVADGIEKIPSNLHIWTTAFLTGGQSAYAHTYLQGKLYVISSTLTNTVSWGVSILDNRGGTYGTIPLGTTPRRIVSFGSKLYITNTNNTVTIIDTGNNNKMTSIPVGSDPMEMTASDGKVYVANRSSGTVSIIDAGMDSVVMMISLKSGIYGITAAGTNVYVTNDNQQAADGSTGAISVIDTRTGAVTCPAGASSSRSSSPGFCGIAHFLKSLSMDTPSRIAVTPDGTKAYVTSGSGTDVSVIDTATNTVSATVNVGKGVTGIAITPDGRKAYVTHGLDGSLASNYQNSVSVIDTATNTVSATVNVVPSSVGVVISPDGRNVYILNNRSAGYNSNAISVIDTAMNAVTAIVNISGVSDWMWDIAISSDGKTLYVTHAENGSAYTNGSIYTIDTATHAVHSTVTVGSNPTSIAISPDGKKAFIACLTNGLGAQGVNGTVFVIDTATNAIAAKVSVGGSPGSVAFSPDGTRAFVSHSGSAGGSVSVIDTATNAVMGTMDVGMLPVGIAITPDDKTAYVANISRADNSVSVINIDPNLCAASSRSSLGSSVSSSAMQTSSSSSAQNSSVQGSSSQGLSSSSVVSVDQMSSSSNTGANVCGNGILEQFEYCGEPGAPTCAAGLVCQNCYCVPSTPVHMLCAPFCRADGVATRCKRVCADFGGIDPREVLCDGNSVPEFTCVVSDAPDCTYTCGE
jgi:cysteine-rich repeat protein/YVTN family beta-propeller protein